MGIEITGLGSLLLLALNIWAFVSIFGSNTTTGKKVVWCLLVLLLPLLGFIIWLFAGPRAASDVRA
ncbi:MAG: PLDc N-terminal domain-containing protein [Pseudomonadota bacterium]|mgnify:CR=1 FL=1